MSTGRLSHRRSALVLALIVVALTSAACGGGKRPSLDARESPSAASPKRTTTTLATTERDGGVVAASAGSQATTTTSWEGHVVLMPDWFSVTTDRSCYHAGDTLTFTAERGIPYNLLIYDTEYGDNTSNVTNDYGTGSGYEKFDEDGVRRTTFVLDASVPPGETWLHVASTNSDGDIIQARTSFLIKPLTEDCP